MYLTYYQNLQFADIIWRFSILKSFEKKNWTFKANTVLWVDSIDQ